MSNHKFQFSSLDQPTNQPTSPTQRNAACSTWRIYMLPSTTTRTNAFGKPRVFQDARDRLEMLLLLLLLLYSYQPDIKSSIVSFKYTVFLSSKYNIRFQHQHIPLLHFQFKNIMMVIVFLRVIRIVQTVCHSKRRRRRDW
jgi:hypothetical protein